MILDFDELNESAVRRRARETNPLFSIGWR